MARWTRTSQASCASTDGTPYAPLPGAAAKRSPTSRWTIATQRVTPSSSSIVRRIAPAAMPYGRFATTFVGAGSSAAKVERHRVGDVQGRVVERGERVLEGGHERAVELDDVDVGAPRREVLAEYAEPAPDLEHDVGGIELRGALDDPEDVRVDEEVLAEVAPGADAERPKPAERRLGREVSRRVGGRRVRQRAHHPNSPAALRSTTCSTSP